MEIFGFKYRVPSHWMLLGGGIAGAGYFLSQALFIDKTKVFLQSYRYDQPMPVDKYLEEMAEEVLKSAKIAKKVRDPPFGLRKYNFFNLNGFDAFHVGTPNLAKGCLIGIPRHFSYRSVQDVDTVAIHIRPTGTKGIPVNWQSGPGKELLDSLVLSDDAKRFAILREIYAANNEWPSIKTANLISAGLLAGAFGHICIDRVGMLRSRMLNACCWILGIVVGLVQWVMVLQILQQILDTSSDKEAVGTDFDKYKPAALEYYNKLLQQNKALRSLAPEIFEKKFTAEGDSKGIFHLGRPLTERIKTIESLERQDT